MKEDLEGTYRGTFVKNGRKDGSMREVLCVAEKGMLKRDRQNRYRNLTMMMVNFST